MWPFRASSQVSPEFQLCALFLRIFEEMESSSFQTGSQAVEQALQFGTQLKFNCSTILRHVKVFDAASGKAANACDDRFSWDDHPPLHDVSASSLAVK
jgi:hypothetical protein